MSTLAETAEYPGGMRILLPLLALTSWALATSAGAQEEDPRTTELLGLGGYFPFDPPATPADWEVRREQVRRRVLIAAGLWPEPDHHPTSPLVYGRIEREGYTVEHFTFESLPGYRVSGSLYRPSSGEGPFPGVLSPHGHWEEGRFNVISDEEAIAEIEAGRERHLANAKYILQARCAQLARMGCVVLHYDMIGYADNQQLEHGNGFGDLEAELWSMSAFGLQTRNSIHALDALLQLEDVDPQRIAVTGGSGGGTQTFVLGAIDLRPALLFPAVMVSTRMQGGCICENATYLRVDTGNVEISALAAPRPMGQVGADDWTKEILTKGGPELTSLYETLGAADHLQLWCEPTHPHNYNLTTRGRLYGFVNEHFELGLEEPIVEAPIVPIAAQDLSVYSETHPRPSGGIEAIRARMLEVAKRQREALSKLAPDEYARVVRGALQTMLTPRSTEAVHERGEGEERLVHAGGTARFHVTQNATPRMLCADYPNLTLAEALCDEPGVIVTHPFDGTLRNGNRRNYVAYTYGYNLTHIAHRVQDLRVMSDHAGGPVALMGEGREARAALLVAALEPERFTRVALEWKSFDSVTGLEDRDFFPASERMGGAEAFAALIAPTPLTLIGVDEVPELVRKAYRAAGAEDQVRAVAAPHARTLAGWLLGKNE